jgi:hypothetical protein
MRNLMQDLTERLSQVEDRVALYNRRVARFAEQDEGGGIGYPNY